MSSLTVKDLLLAPRLDRQQVVSLLSPFGFRDIARADANLQAIAIDPSERQLLADILLDLLSCFSASADPDQALSYFERFAQSALNKTRLFTYLKDSPNLIETLAKVLGGSPYMAEILIRDPHHFYWLTDPRILNNGRIKREIQRELLRTLKILADPDKQIDYLRVLKRREMLHIGVRDLLRLTSVDETLTALSVLAEVLISGAYWICRSALRRECGISGKVFVGFTVLAMGKLGGGELNFSSDVDLIYVYALDDESTTTDGHAEPIQAAEYFRRLSQRITVALNNFSSEGYVYRVDLRLRPEGKAGNIADSLAGYKRYYDSRAGTWERLALLKAWPVAGNRELGARFLAMAQEIIFRKPFDRRAIDDVRDMKRRIDKQLSSRPQRGRNVKLGTGGIREIELIAQSLQVCHGETSSILRERKTLKALIALQQNGLISDDELRKLTAAYIFLRDVENKLQMVNDAQTHSLPETEEELTACARRLGYTNTDQATAADLLMRDYEVHTTQVSRIFEDVFGTDGTRRFAGSDV